MTILAWILVLVAVALAVVMWRMTFKGTALVLFSYPIVLFADTVWGTMSGGDWTWFWIAFIILGLISLMGRRFSSRGLTIAGVTMLLFAIILATPFSLWDTAKNTVAAITAPSQEALIEAFNKDVQGEYDSADARLDAIEAKNAEQDKRLDANDVKNAEQDARLKALEEKDKTLETKIVDLNAKVTGIVTSELPNDLTKEQLADAVSTDMVRRHFNPDQVTFFTINWKENEYDVGSNPFSDRMIDSNYKLRKHISGPSEQSKATRAHILAALPASEEARALDGKGYVPVQFHTRVCYDGNTWFNPKEKKAIPQGTTCHEAGDVIWVYVGSNGKVYWDASVRADCGNPGMTSAPRPDNPGKQSKPRHTTPVTPGTPTTPGTSTPTPSKSTSTPTPSSTCPSGHYCTPKATATSAPSVSPRPSGTSTAKPSSRPTHSGPVITSGPTSSPTRSSDGHTASPSPEVTSTATRTVGDG